MEFAIGRYRQEQAVTVTLLVYFHTAGMHTFKNLTFFVFLRIDLSGSNKENGDGAYSCLGQHCLSLGPCAAGEEAGHQPCVP